MLRVRESLIKYDYDVLPRQVKGQGNVLDCICIFARFICIASQVLYDLSSKREKGLWTGFGPNSPPLSTKGHTRVGFCGWGVPDMGACLDTRKEHQATQEPWEVSLPGVKISFPWMSVPNTVFLVGSLLGHTTIPCLRQSSFISLSQKKIWT